jgi:hypothetical protein
MSDSRKKATSDSRKKDTTPFLARVDSIRLTNGVIALTTRLFTSSVLAIVRTSRRKRLR